ncbi:MAG: hypothetical protein KAU95_02645 [Candidatus Aenigmarchaeota archaeon]|nr:hypothetical protein [Candidatus Aenigmarchaeota archaeon]
MDIKKEDYDQISKYFKVAFKIKERGNNFGVTQEVCNQLISIEFDRVTPEVIQRHYHNMIWSKIITVGSTGVKANPNLEKRFSDFEENKNII